MALDGTVIVAQIINFALLVWLLNRFLYRPITNMIQAREDRLRRRMEEVQALEAEAQRALAAYRERKAELDRERTRLLEEARQAAGEERTRLLENAAKEAQVARRQFAETLAAERVELASSIQESLVQQVCDTSGSIMSHLGGTSLADAIIGTLEAQWEEEGLTGSPPRPHVGDGKALVRTSFQPTEEQKARLAALTAKMRSDLFSSPHGQPGNDQPEVEFEIAPALLLGVEIEIGGTALSWTARDLLEDLQQSALASLLPSTGKRDAPFVGEAKTGA